MKKTIVTHNESFHSDDVFAVALLLKVLNKEAEIVRTRDEKKIAEADIVIDVGGEYDKEKDRFDHHQKGGAGIRKNGIPYASFGLVWDKYGMEFCLSEEVFSLVEEKLVQPIDANDNGVSIIEGKYENIFPYTIQDILFAIQPTWKEEDTDINSLFLRACDIAGLILEREILKAIHEEEAKVFVQKTYQASADKRIIILDRWYPWKDKIFNYSEPLFIIYPKKSKWHIRAVPASKDSFEVKRKFPSDWCGLRGEELEKVSGIEGAVFCHNNGFLAVTDSKDGALSLVNKAL